MVEGVPLPAHEPGAHVDLLDGGVEELAAARPLEGGEVAVDRVVGRDVGDAVRGDLELVQVGREAVAAR